MANSLRSLAFAALLALAVPGLARADGIDCHAARAPIDRSICGTPALLERDRALAAAFAASVARDAAHAADLRRDEIAWLKARNAECGPRADDAARAACLATYYAKRLAELAPPPASPAPPVAAAPPATETPPAPLAAVAPEPPSPMPPPPAVALPEAAASLDQTKLPAAPRLETLLHVTAPGRFALSATSATGTALQLVDMLTGPSDIAGEAGSVDGRLDALLEQGTYKLRAFAAVGATGDVTLSAVPFRDAAPPRTLDLGQPLHTELGNLQQLSFWLEVRPNTPIRIEAAGRALADLKLWRNGTDLMPIAPDVREIESTGGHPLTDMVLRGTPEPGTYLLTAYGGGKLVWADGATEQPFHLRAAPSQALQAGATAGGIGPFGSEWFAIPEPAATLRLDLPQAADVQLALVANGTTQETASIAHNARAPVAWLNIPQSGDPTRQIEVTGTEGQAFNLRLEDTAGLGTTRPGRYWISASTSGLGGDEPPATALFVRRTGNGPTEIAGAYAPRVGPALAWRQRFNLRGPVGLLFEAAAAGPVALRTDGPRVQATVEPVGGPPPPPRADGAKPDVWDLAAGWYRLFLTPFQGAAGSLDVTLGPPGLLPDHPAQAQPADPALTLGLVTLEPNERLTLFNSTAVGATVGFGRRPAPVDLAEAPLTVTQDAGAALDVPVQLPLDGRLAALEIGGAPTAVGFTADPTATGVRIGTAHLPAPAHARNVALSWQPPPTAQPPVPPPTPPDALDALGAGAPRFLDLGRDQQRSFLLTVPEGGLFRVETVGRLRTAGAIATAFIPDLDDADANGIGQNFLLQRFLRAGSYRVRVTAQESAGRLGLVARPAPVATGPTLVPGGSVRAALAADAGVVVPIEIAAGGRYHLDLLSLTNGLTARLEDAEGWPLLRAGDLSSLDQTLSPGPYRLLLQPAGIAARVVARLARLEEPAAHVGHGPFPLAFGSMQSATWREPPGRDDPRTPDAWTFALAGPAAVTLAVSEGMVADLLAEGADLPLARFTSDNPFAGTLPAGAWRVRASSLGRNDRLDYTLALASHELQPGRPRHVTLPTSVPFAIADDRVVSLTTFGRIPLRAVLRRADGHVVERVGDRGTDWNIGLSRRLPAGAYTLELASAAPGRPEPVAPADAQQQTGDDQGDNQGAAPAQDAPQEQPADSADAAPDRGAVEVSLALPDDRAPVIAAAEGVTELAGGGVHHLLLPTPPPGALTVAAAASSADLVLALERRDAAGVWQTVTVARGTTPVAGALAGEGWRASVWTLDGGQEPIRFAARTVASSPVPLGEVAAVPLDVGGLPQSLAVAHVAVPGAGALRLSGDAAGLQTVFADGAPLVPLAGALVLPQSDDLWLLARGRPDKLALAPVATTPGQPLALAIPEGGQALLQGAPPADGSTRLWLAESGLGQPGVEAGRGMGVAAGSALALAGGGGPARLFDAGAADALQLQATVLDLANVAARALEAPFAENVPARSVLPLRLPDGTHSVHLDLAAGTAAILNPRDPHAITVWTGNAGLSRTLEADGAELLLVNTGAEAAPAGVSWTTGDAPALALRPGVPIKRFFGAAGSLDLLVAGTGRLVVAGGSATLIGEDGHVARGTFLPVAGPGRVILDHGPGLLAAWIEGGDTPPWPEPAPETVALPAHLPLHDAAMALALSPATPVLLHIDTTAPVILAIGDEPPKMFPAGADWHRYLPPGPATLRIISPHDGPLAGTLDLAAAPVAEAAEGIGPTVAVAPGGTAAFGFRVEHLGPVGLGVRAEPDDVAVRLLDASGRMLGEGVAQLRWLKPGRYVLEARVPPDAPATLVRPALVGLVAQPDGPPQDIVNSYLERAGRAPIPAAAKGTAP